LRDSNDFGAKPVSDQHYYGVVRAGMGRWAVLERLGVLWTDDQDALQLSRLNGADQAAAYQFRLDLHALAAANVPATTAFDRLVTERAATVTSGNLADIPSDS
jgi:hypothetical protein